MYILKNPVSLLFLAFLITTISCSTGKPLFETDPNFNPSTYLNPQDYGYDLKMNSKSILSELNANPFKPIRLMDGLQDLNESKDYPRSAMRNQIQGEVLLEVYVDTLKKIREIKVIESPSSLLTKSAIEAIVKADFKYATKNGNPVNSFIRIPLEYKFYEVEVRRRIDY